MKFCKTFVFAVLVIVALAGITGLSFAIEYQRQSDLRRQQNEICLDMQCVGLYAYEEQDGDYTASYVTTEFVYLNQSWIGNNYFLYLQNDSLPYRYTCCFDSDDLSAPSLQVYTEKTYMYWSPSNYVIIAAGLVLMICALYVYFGLCLTSCSEAIRTSDYANI